MQFVILLNSFLPLFLIIGVAIRNRLKKGDERGDQLWLVLMSGFGLFLISKEVVEALRVLIPVKYDQYMFCLDHSFGDPSFHAGQFLLHHLWLAYSVEAGYLMLTTPLFLLAVAYFLTQPLADAMNYVRVIALNFLLAIPLYAIFPVAGPKYAFDSFPWVVPIVTHPHAVRFFAIPNGVPSVHTSTALLILYFARRWRIGVLLGSLYLAAIVLSTMGMGEHYLVDLLTAIPYTFLLLYLGGSNTCISVREEALVESRV